MSSQKKPLPNKRGPPVLQRRGNASDPEVKEKQEPAQKNEGVQEEEKKGEKPLIRCVGTVHLTLIRGGWSWVMNCYNPQAPHHITRISAFEYKCQLLFNNQSDQV